MQVRWKKRPMLIYLTGTMFSVAWWLFIDAVIKDQWYPVDLICGLLSSVGLAMLSIVKVEDL